MKRRRTWKGHEARQVKEMLKKLRKNGVKRRDNGDTAKCERYQEHHRTLY